jgi:hypothetical protein
MAEDGRNKTPTTSDVFTDNSTGNSVLKKRMYCTSPMSLII